MKWIQGSQVSSHHKTLLLPWGLKKTKNKKKEHLNSSPSFPPSVLPSFLLAWCKFLLMWICVTVTCSPFSSLYLAPSSAKLRPTTTNSQTSSLNNHEASHYPRNALPVLPQLFPPIQPHMWSCLVLMAIPAESSFYITWHSNLAQINRLVDG